MKRTAAVGVLGVLLLSGCSAPPSAEEVSERFAIELAANIGEPEDWTELADLLAEAARGGSCGEEAYWSEIANEPTMLYAWASGCSMYFESDMSAEQRERAREVIISAALDDLGE